MNRPCRERYLQVREMFPNNFSAGFVAGQCEKIFLGACRAAMFRAPLIEIVTIAEIYDLAYYAIGAEFWVARYENRQLFNLLTVDKSSHEQKALRGFLCGVHDIDLEFPDQP